MTAYGDFDKYLQAQKRRVVLAEAEAMARGKYNRVGIAAEMRAGIFVWTGAAIEQFVASLLKEALEFISAQPIVASDLRYELFSFFCDRDFHGVRSGDQRVSWMSRIEIMRMLEAADPVVLTGSGPLDGKTIRPYHFEAIWMTFALPGSPWPGGVHQAVLKDLADRRNEVAHGSVDPVEFGRQRTFEDCLKMLGRIDEIAMHATIVLDSYLHSASYRR